MKSIDELESKKNYYNFLWHATFLALASSFMDIDTIMPAMLGDIGGSAFEIGLLITIMLGGSTFSQIIFAPFIHNQNKKKSLLLIGIHLRIFALFSLFMVFFFSDTLKAQQMVYIILGIVSLFSFSGAFANISYTDILGKSILKKQRKTFLSMKQIVTAIGVFISAFLAKKVLLWQELPRGYAFLFLGAGFFLLIATKGFWKLSEGKNKEHQIMALRVFFLFVRKELIENKRLRHYLALTSTLGISLSILPFLIVFAREQSIFDVISLGQLLLFKIIGVVLTGAFFFFLAKRFTYNFSLYAIVGIALILPLFAKLSRQNPYLFIVAFFLGGILVATYKIAIDGVLLEISNVQNRAMYTGLVGLGNVIPAVFPLIGGIIIKTQGFNVFFTLFTTIVFSSLIFIRFLDCKH